MTNLLPAILTLSLSACGDATPSSYSEKEIIKYYYLPDGSIIGSELSEEELEDIYSADIEPALAPGASAAPADTPVVGEEDEPEEEQGEPEEEEQGEPEEEGQDEPEEQEQDEPEPEPEEDPLCTPAIVEECARQNWLVLGNMDYQCQAGVCVGCYFDSTTGPESNIAACYNAYGWRYQTPMICDIAVKDGEDHPILFDDVGNPNLLPAKDISGNGTLWCFN